MNKQEILSRLDYRTFYKSLLPSLKENGKPEAMALCPFHDDHNPSLSVNLENGLYHCFACDAKGNVFSFYQNLKGVDFKTALTEIGRIAGVEANPITSYGKVVATFEYKDTNGKILYIKERIEPGRNGRSKDFIFKHSGNTLGRGCNPVPYNLPEVIKSKYVIFVEGERKVEVLREWGLVATCLDSGANSPCCDDYLPCFEGKEKVVILPDSDSPGKAYAQKIANALYGKVGEIKIVELPGLGESEDIIDWVRNGGTKNQLLEIVKTAPVWSPPKEESVRLISAQDILDLNEDLNWTVDGLIPQGGIVMVSGRPGVGKTWLALILAKAVSEGLPFIGRGVQRARVAYIDLENPKAILRERISKIRPMSVEFAPAWAMAEPFTLQDGDIDRLAKEGYLIILDSLVRAHGFDENSAQEMAKVMNRLRGLTHKGATIVFLHHRGKGENNEYRGSSDILAGVDVAYLLDSKDGHLELKTLKSRVGIELKIPLSLKIDPDRVELQDLTHVIEAQRLVEEKEQLESLKDLIEDYKNREGCYPTQADLIKACKELYEWGMNRTIELLKEGRGRFWNEEDDSGDRRKNGISLLKIPLTL